MYLLYTKSWAKVFTDLSLIPYYITWRWCGLVRSVFPNCGLSESTETSITWEFARNPTYWIQPAEWNFGRCGAPVCTLPSSLGDSDTFSSWRSPGWGVTCSPCFSKTALKLRLKNCIPAQSSKDWEQALVWQSQILQHSAMREGPHRRNQTKPKTVTLELGRGLQFKGSSVFASKQSRNVFVERDRCQVGTESGPRVPSPWKRKVKTDVGWCVQKSLIWSPALGLQRGMFSGSKWLRSLGQRWDVSLLPSNLPHPPIPPGKISSSNVSGSLWS